MAVFFTQTCRIYKRFKIDIWGLFKNHLGIKNGPFFFFKFITNKSAKISYIFKKFSVKIVNKRVKKIKEEYLTRFFQKRNKSICAQLWKYNKGLVLKYNGIFLKKTIWFKSLEFFLNTQPSKRSDWLCWFFYGNFIKLKRAFLWNKNTKFIYDIRERFIKQKRIILKKDFANLRLVKMYYIMFTYRQFKQIARKAKYSDGLFEENYLYLLECRLPAFIYRTSLMGNMFETIKFVKNNNVWVNKYFVSFIFYYVKCMIPVGFRIMFKGFIYWSLYKRLRRRALMFNRPKNMYISLNLFIIYMLKRPCINNIVYPFAIDIYRACNIAY